MRFPLSIPAIVIGLACAVSAGPAAAQQTRDFAFVDEEGHRILRFAGTTTSELTEDQRDEIVNAEFSQMVHDHIRADIRFDAEIADPAWASDMALVLEAHLRQIEPDYSTTIAECRAMTCRLRLEHEHWPDVAGHLAMMDDVQASIESFLEHNPGRFERVFLITAYAQQDMPNIRVFLKRSDG